MQLQPRAAREPAASPVGSADARSVADGDGDGIEDTRDACPTEPGMNSREPQRRGCPVRPVANVAVLAPYPFAPNEARLGSPREGIADLPAWAEWLKQRPALCAVIHGHADARLDREPRAELSQQRAEAVRDYLVKEGRVTAQRLLALGYGERCSREAPESPAPTRRASIAFVPCPPRAPDPPIACSNAGELLELEPP